MKNIRRVACGVSGGVDSAVSALLLKLKGFDVHAVFMTNWDQTNETGKCTIDEDREDAKFVCKELNIPFTDVNFVKEYWNEVFSEMINDYENGLTPNPDVLCNRHIKFGSFYKYATENLGADATATGHYARNSYGNYLEHKSRDKKAHLLIPRDSWKDQTLFLSQINQTALQNHMFPVGDLLKKDVKKIASEAGLCPVASKKESMGICFIGSRNFNSFIDEYLEPRVGNMVDEITGRVVSQHNGTYHWTIGQRALIGGLNVAYFISKIDAKSNIVFVVPGSKHPALFTQHLHTNIPHWISESPEEFNTGQCYSCQFRFQHIHPLIDCSITLNSNGRLHVTLEQPMRAMTPGQYAVFYKDNECLGSAQILSSGPTLYELNQTEPVKLEAKFS